MIERIFINVNWEIRNFSYYRDGDSPLKSPIFHSSSTVWLLSLKQSRISNEDFVFVDVRPYDNTPKGSLNCAFELVTSGPAESSSDQDKVELKRAEKWEARMKIRDTKTNPLIIHCKLWNEDSSEEITHFLSTIIGFENVSFSWVIPDFTALSSNKKVSKEVPSDVKPSMTLSLFHEQSMVKIEAKLGGSKETTHVKFDISIASLNTFNQRVVEHTFAAALTEQVKLIFPKYIERSRLLLGKDRLPEPTLTLLCTCTVSTGIVTDQVTYNPNMLLHLNHSLVGESALSKNTFPSDLKKMYEDKSWCDLEICCRTEEKFPVHRNILSVRAPDLVKADTSSHIRETMTLPDLSGDTLKRILLFLYTDTVECIDYRSSIKLYLAADKYRIEPLKQKVLQFMKVPPDVDKIIRLYKKRHTDEELKSLTQSYLKTNINVTNACQVLLTANSYQDQQLKDLAKKFIMDNDTLVLTSKKWKNLMETNPGLTSETLQDMYLKRIKGQKRSASPSCPQSNLKSSKKV